MDYIILDIEFNGRKFASELPMEVIEIGAVRLDASLQMKDTFTSLIRPVYFSKLNSFIKKKTGIPQPDIDAAPRFPKVIGEFRRWLDRSEDGVLLITWGGEDLKRIVQDTRMHKLDDSYWLAVDTFDLLKGYLRVQQLSNDVSVEAALQQLDIPAEGSAHRALDDAVMTGEIFKAVFDRLDFTRIQKYKDTYSNARERKLVKTAIKAIQSQKLVPTWPMIAEHYFAGKIPLDDPRKENELREYFDAQWELAKHRPVPPKRPPAGPAETWGDEGRAGGSTQAGGEAARAAGAGQAGSEGTGTSDPSQPGSEESRAAAVRGEAAGQEPGQPDAAHQ